MRKGFSEMIAQYGIMILVLIIVVLAILYFYNFFK